MLTRNITEKSNISNETFSLQKKKKGKKNPINLQTARETILNVNET